MNKRKPQIFLQKIRHVLYLLHNAFVSKKVQPDNETVIDVVIPAIESDLDILPLCLQGLKNNVQQRIGKIYLVSPGTQRIKEFATQHGLTFIDESSVLGYSPADINYVVYTGLNRSGWIFQQLLKLSGKIGDAEYFMVIDADHILLQPHVFVSTDKKMVFYQSSEYNIPYYRNIKKLLGNYPVSWFSYVSHKMIFKKSELISLHKSIEANSSTKESWDKIIISHLDKNEVNCFSEFELYGNFVDKDKKITLPWKDKMLKRDRLASYEELKKDYPQYLSVTFPHYLNKTKK